MNATKITNSFLKEALSLRHLADFVSILTLSAFENSMVRLLEDFKEKNYLLAVSGGVDSMVLLHLFQVAGYKFQVAHINYKLRGEDSDSDQKLVEDFCRKYNIKLHVYEVSAKDEKPQGSIQVWARNIRYDFFRKIMDEEKIDHLVTAHHLNDQLETFLINLSRGSGIKGLSGIPSNENEIIRPLLNFSKEEIYRFAKEHNIDFREDLSNQKNDYLRNEIRNEIVPKLLQTNDDFLENFKKSIDILDQTKDFVEQQIDVKLDSLIIANNDSIILNKTKFKEESDFVKYEILKRFGFTDVKEIPKIFKAKTGSIFNSAAFKLAVNRDEIILELKTEENTAKREKIELNINSKNEIIITEKIKDEISEFGTFEWKFDSQKFSLPLYLRHKTEGDTFFPIGMIGKKKVSKFFKDEKISILAKPKIWLLCDGNDNVLGILPFRQDRRFAADNGTENIVIIRSKTT